MTSMQNSIHLIFLVILVCSQLSGQSDTLMILEGSSQNGSGIGALSYEHHTGFKGENNYVGFWAENSNRDGLYTYKNGGDGVQASYNDHSGFKANNNESDGFYATANTGYAAYLTSPASRTGAAVFISHFGDKKDLRFGGHARIKAEGSFVITLNNYNNVSGQSFQIRDSSENIVLRVLDNGEVEADGIVCAPNFTSCSDRRYKKNIFTLSSSLSNLSLINGVSYNWDQEKWPERNFSDRPQIGFIAQELEAVYPELVLTDEDGYKSVAYNKMTAVLVEAVKELKAENAELKSENEELKQIINGIEARVSSLEKLE